MSTVMTATNVPNESTQTPHHRRSREEMEALAKSFVATPTEDAPAKSSKLLTMAGVGGAVVLAGVVAFFALRSGGQETRQDSAAAARAAAEVEEIQQRLEAERERARKELEAGSDYLERIGAADAALVEDLSARADRLAARQAAAAPAPSYDAPTPREEPRTTTPAPTTTLKPAAAPTIKVEPVPQQPVAVAKAEPAKAEPAKTEVAKAEPAKAAEVAKCEIHVSELSRSGTLTYEAIKKMKGVRVDDFTGHVFTPPVMTGAGRKVVFEVMPTGCVRVAKR